MPKIREAVKDGEIRLLISVDAVTDIAAMDLLDYLIEQNPEGTMKDVIALLDHATWWAIALASSQGFDKFINDASFKEAP